jgi:hypothetical protein
MSIAFFLLLSSSHLLLFQNLESGIWNFEFCVKNEDLTPMFARRFVWETNPTSH